jgi:hypothetical protein
MRVRVDIVWGEGEGKTPISAYDCALSKAGIAHFNLISLSSVIPPHSTMRECGPWCRQRLWAEDIRWQDWAGFTHLRVVSFMRHLALQYRLSPRTLDRDFRI